jgi:hypothetical protein
MLAKEKKPLPGPGERLPLCQIRVKQEKPPAGERLQRLS